MLKFAVLPAAAVAGLLSLGGCSTPAPAPATAAPTVTVTTSAPATSAAAPASSTAAAPTSKASSAAPATSPAAKGGLPAAIGKRAQVGAPGERGTWKFAKYLDPADASVLTLQFEYTPGTQFQPMAVLKDMGAGNIESVANGVWCGVNQTSGAPSCSMAAGGNTYLASGPRQLPTSVVAEFLQAGAKAMS